MSAQNREVLIVTGDVQEQQDLRKFLLELGLAPSVVGDAAEACELCGKRSFAVALVDSDTPTPGAGLELLWALRRQSPATSVIVLTAYKSFELAVNALRGGACDVVIKAADQIDYLRQRVLALCSEHGAKAERERLLGESAGLNEEFLRRLTDMARKVGELRDQVQGSQRSSSGTSPLPEDEECRVLVVEEDGWLTRELSHRLPKGYVLRSVVSGGSALDKASAQRFHIALVKEGLPDLPGRMVVRTLAVQSPETIALLFTPPGEKPGQVQVVEGSHMIKLLPEFTAASQLADRLGELREAQKTRGRERRYLSAFREENYELLRRYADLRQKIGRTP